MQWLNEPKSWSKTGELLEVSTMHKTDFWRETHYGFVHDNGHFYYRKITGDFTAGVTFHADYESLYDQAGMMIRFSELCWLKAGAEFVHGNCTIGTVLTRNQSDWAIGPIVSRVDPLRLRITRRGGTVCVQWAPADQAVQFQTLRLGTLSEEPETMVGLMTCSPSRSGLVSRFENFTVSPPINFESEV